VSTVALTTFLRQYSDKHGFLAHAHAHTYGMLTYTTTYTHKPGIIGGEDVKRAALLDELHRRNGPRPRVGIVDRIVARRQPTNCRG